mmetsp:Transcript_22909/g.35856  ORF Transcript_22909/g.35856 Transcript_22909/m.35856 type:complete len:271 (-) Transcript_22909:101-913(-)
MMVLRLSHHTHYPLAAAIATAPAHHVSLPLWSHVSKDLPRFQTRLRGGGPEIGVQGQGLSGFLLGFLVSRILLAFTQQFHPVPEKNEAQAQAGQTRSHRRGGRTAEQRDTINKVIPSISSSNTRDLATHTPRTGSHTSRDRATRRSSQAPSVTGQSLKMVLCVRKDLKMTTGKIASQCCHAALGAYTTFSGNPGLLQGWEAAGQPKIVVQIPSLGAMRSIQRSCQLSGIHTFEVQDAGRTQVMQGSATVLACGPASNAALDSITGRLHLL